MVLCVHVDCENTCTSDCCKCSPSCNCAGQFLMNPSSSISTDVFSACTKETVCPLMSKWQCLKDSPDSILKFELNKCGNGILEAGEDCDCGDLCDKDACCTKDCKLKPGAKCSDKNQGCCSQCQIKPQGSLCRAKEGGCDSEEICNGNSASCPKDQFTQNGAACIEKGFAGQCASKYCTSTDKQCKDAYPSATGSCSPWSSFQNDCILTCQQPQGCLQYETYYIEGTLCGGGYGQCKGGQCEYASERTLNSFRRQDYGISQSQQDICDRGWHNHWTSIAHIYHQEDQ